MSPIPREIQARTGHKLANPGLVTLDVQGNTATNGQYLFPFGINLGGISVQEFVEVDLDLINTPTEFAGIPWNFDRRLSPGGCNGACETDAIDNTYKYRLDPFPFENLDPRTQANFLVAGLPGGLPTGSYTDNIYHGQRAHRRAEPDLLLRGPGSREVQRRQHGHPVQLHSRGQASVLREAPRVSAG